MTVTFVSAFLRPKTSYRSTDAYFAEFEKLADTGVSIVLFLDDDFKDKTFPPNVLVVSSTLHTDWVPEDVRLPAYRTPTKDTVDYYCIQLMKLWYLREAVALTDTSHIAWIDFGAFHMFKDSSQCQQLLRDIAVSDFPTEVILAPGCWPSGAYDWTSVCWRFCGTFLLGHRDLFEAAYQRQCQVVQSKLPCLTWEVNYWAEMEDLFEIYVADHDDTLLSRVTMFVQRHQGV